MNAQTLEALGRANQIRTHRADLKCLLSEKKVMFCDLDLDDPMLQTMRVEELLRALPWKSGPRKPQPRITTAARARTSKVFYAMQLPASARLGALSPARKQELKEQVARICPSQRVPK